MSNIKGIDDVKEENDDEKRQAYYAGGQGQNGGGRQASTAPLLPSDCPLNVLAAAPADAHYCGL